jgi:hypothetical protein
LSKTTQCPFQSLRNPTRNPTPEKTFDDPIAIFEGAAAKLLAIQV